MKIFRTTSLLLLISLIFLTGCTSVQNGPGRNDRTRSTGHQSESLEDAMEREYLAAKAAAEAGNHEEVERRLDQIVLLYLDAEPNSAEVARARETFENLLAMAYQLELPEKTEDLIPPEQDVFAELDTSLTPEQAEQGRALMNQKPITLSIPVPNNNEVVAFLNYFQGKGRGTMQRGLERSGRYMPLIRETFRKNGIPEELAFLALIESSYKPRALSRAGARGVWQFMPGTGRRYGLKIDYWIDERSDVEKATQAAASYLKDLYGMFGDWHLAMASYNCGEGRVKRKLKKYPNGDFWTLHSKRQIPKETRNYVPAVLAAMLIGTNPSQYGFDPVYHAPLTFERCEIDMQTDLKVCAKAGKVSYEELMDLNPELRAGITPKVKGPYSIRVPKGSAEVLLANLALVPKDKRILVVYHKVRRGDTLGAIARRHGASVRAIMDANNISNPRHLKVGKNLMIPKHGTSYKIASSSRNRKSGSVGRATSSKHKIRKGDTLSGIAQRYGTSVKALCRANGISTRTTLKIGRRLLIPGGGGTSSGSKSTPMASKKSSNSRSHKVKNGDTLSGIAQRYGTSVKALCGANGINTRTTLKLGRRLTIPAKTSSTKTVKNVPAGRRHTVRKGDTLYDLARTYRTSVDKLCKLNRISKNHTLFPGESLRVP